MTTTLNISWSAEGPKSVFVSSIEERRRGDGHAWRVEADRPIRICPAAEVAEAAAEGLLTVGSHELAWTPRGLVLWHNTDRVVTQPGPDYGRLVFQAAPCDWSQEQIFQAIRHYRHGV